YPDYQLPWDVVERHVEWLQALEAVMKQGGTYELTDYGKGLLKDISPQQGQLTDFNETMDTPPRVWIEKTSVEGRKYKKQGELELGNAIYSPTQDKGGGDIYATMRESIGW
ncbi:hypothetical protein, partial [Haloferax profundi]|uniref:hypothetical protein n=1 Tax=Haloferax profundi TaxID=1544718 RepID=UPI000AFD958E